MRDPQRELEHLRKLAEAEPTKRFGKLLKMLAQHRLDFTGEPDAARSCPSGSEGAGRRRTPAMVQRAALLPYNEERKSRAPKHKQQTWTTFLRDHASQIWACDFLQTYDVFFRTVFVFVIIELGSRRVAHFGVTRNPTDQWTAQQLREATPFGAGPRFLIRDNDAKFGPSFTRVAKGTSIEVLRTPYRAPRANATCERFLGSLRRECLDHFLILGERHLHRLVKEYMAYFNHARPHQGIEQHIPCQPDRPQSPLLAGKVASRPVLSGLHHDYYWQAAESVAQRTRQPSNYLH